jgi:hypothetical protein
VREPLLQKLVECNHDIEGGGVSVWGRFYFLAGRITNPPWGALLRSRIRNPAGFTMLAPKLKRAAVQLDRLKTAGIQDRIGWFVSSFTFKPHFLTLLG